MLKHAFEGGGWGRLLVVVWMHYLTHRHTQCYVSTPGHARDMQIRLNAQM